MKSIEELCQKTLFEKKPEFNKITNERQLVIKDFLDRLNLERGNRKPLTPGFIASKMSMLSTRELKAFYKDCERAKHFSKYWCSSILVSDAISVLQINW